MKHHALEASGVSKRYGERDALSSVDLIAQPGRLHGLLGPNGAGKTTLMRVVLGLVRRDSGSVRLLGHARELAPAPPPDGVAGFVDTPSFYPYLNGRHNLELLARLDRPQGRRPSITVDGALEQVGLGARGDILVSHYSTGMRQRLGLAAALLRSPRLLFLDEPTNSLDPAGARDVRALARRMADEGAAVVLSSHDMAEVESLCEAVTIINAGRVVFSGSVEQLRRFAPAAVHWLSTSDDGIAFEAAADRTGLRVVPNPEGGFDVSAGVEALDAYVIALATAGIAVRALERRTRTLESLFLELTGSAGAGVVRARSLEIPALRPASLVIK